MSERPEFRALVGDDLSPGERARLERVHELLVTAGPPPELPPALLEPPGESPGASLIGLPRRRAGAMLALAAAIALVAFLGGYVAGKNGQGEGFNAIKTLPMHGTGTAEAASATIKIGSPDTSGNLPLRVVVHGLPPLQPGSYYEMFLTKHGRPVAACGIFTVGGRNATVPMTLPGTARGYDGWIVTREAPGDNAHPVVLTT
jgi:anti-sigma-K factor RskA